MAPISPKPAPKPPYVHSTPRKRNRIVGSIQTSLKYREVAEIEGVSFEHVKGVLRRYRAQDYGVSRRGRGRPPALSERDRRLLLRTIDQDPFIHINDLLRESGLTCSRTTLTRSLEKWGIKHARSRQRPFLTEQAAQARYRFSLEHQEKPFSFWRTVLFTDECSVERGCGQKEKWVFRPNGKFDTLFSGTYMGLTHQNYSVSRP